MESNHHMEELPQLLKVYSNSEFIVKKRVKFIFHISLLSIVTLLFLIVFRLGSFKLGPDYIHSSIIGIIPLSILLFLISGSLWMLVKGYLNLAANLIPILISGTTWLIMFLDDQPALIRLDSVVYILATISMLPLLFTRRKTAIPIFVTINILILIGFMMHFKATEEINKAEMWDYLIDVSVSFAFMGLVGYSIFVINKKALDKAESDIRKTTDAETALLNSEKKFRDMTDMLPQAVCETDLNGNLTYMNKSGLQMFGYSDEDFREGINAFNILLEAEKVKENIQGVIQGTLLGNQYNARRKTGDLLPVKIFSSAIVENDQVTGFRGIIIDISDSIKAEQALSNSERKFREMAELLPQTIYESDLNGILTYINKAGTEMFGYSPDDVHLGLNVFTTIAKEDHKRLQENIISIIAGLSTHGNQYTALRKNGTTFPIQIYSSVIREGNIPVGFRGIIYDVSDLMAAYEDIRRKDKLFRDLVESSPVAITLTTLDRKLILANQKFFSETGLSPETAIGKSPWDLGIKGNMEKEELILQLIREKGQVENFETEVYYDDNLTHYIYVFATLVDIESQKAVLRYNINVTEKKMLENQIREYTLKLEDLVKERTSALASTMEELKSTNEKLLSTNDELYRQREQLEMAFKQLRDTQEQLIQTEKMASLGILTAGVAHEINNPINYIYNGSVAIETYIQENLPEHLENLKPLFEAINTGVMRTTNIVKSLSSYSRKEKVAFHKCQIHQILENCITMLYNQYKSRIEIRKEFNDNLPEISANESTLHQVFLNIITNAIQAIDNEGVISIKTIADKESVSVSISDNGKGIKEEDLPYIFDPFFTTKDPGKGTGLGLSIVQRIIKEHHGSINCKTRLNHGTEFIVNLPVSQQ